MPSEPSTRESGLASQGWHPGILARSTVQFAGSISLYHDSSLCDSWKQPGQRHPLSLIHQTGDQVGRGSWHNLGLKMIIHSSHRRPLFRVLPLLLRICLASGRFPAVPSRCESRRANICACEKSRLLALKSANLDKSMSTPAELQPNLHFECMEF